MQGLFQSISWPRDEYFDVPHDQSVTDRIDKASHVFSRHFRPHREHKNSPRLSPKLRAKKNQR